MRKQNGFIDNNDKNWFMRWRETDGDGKRKLRFKILAEVTSLHRKSRDKKTGKLRIPDEVQAAADSVLGVVNTHQADPYLLTITDLVENRFFPDVEKALKPASIENYKFNWAKYLKPAIGRRIVREFERKDAHQLWQTIHQRNPHLRRRSISQIKSVVNSVFKWALDRGLYYGDNPAKASMPSGLPENKVTEAYSIEEVSAILKASIDPKLSAIVAMFFGSGLRKGEVAGFPWENYERLNDGAVLHITQAAWHGKIQTPKTKQSIGDINLGESFCTYIDAYRASLPKGADSGLMFVGRFPGVPMSMDTYARLNLFPILKAAGIPWRGGFHAFRRGNSTFVAKAINSEAAAAQSRHTVEIAEQAYIKANDQERRGAQAAKVASIESKRQELRRQAAGALSDGLQSVN